MTTITAIPDTATASVQLSISKTLAVTRVLRHDENGIAEVRTLAGQLPSNYTTTEVLRNYCINPRGVTATGWVYQGGTSEVATQTLETGAGPNGLNNFIRRTVTTAKTTGNSGHYRNETGLPSGVAGDVWSASMWVRSSAAITVRLSQTFRLAAVSVNNIAGPDVVLVPNVWTQLMTSGPATGNYDGMQVWAVLPSGSIVPVGGTLDATQMLIAETDTLPEFFDGATPADETGSYSWTGTANASATRKLTGGTLLLTDYEAAAGLNSYNVYAADGSFVTASATLGLDKPWLMVPVMPNYALQAETISGYGSERQTSSTVHTVIGRADPLVSFGPLGTRTGSLEIFCASLKAARDLETVFTRGETVMLKQNVPGMDMYFVGSSTGIAPYSAQGEDATRYALTVAYTEIKRPLGSLAGALGWDFNALAAAYASFDVVTSKFATFDDLTIRNEI